MYQHKSQPITFDDCLVTDILTYKQYFIICAVQQGQVVQTNMMLCNLNYGTASVLRSSLKA